MADTPLMDMVNNTYELYDAKNALYDKWIERGDAFDLEKAKGEVINLATKFALAVERELSSEGDEKYSAMDIAEAANEILEDFDEYRDEAIRHAVQEATRTPRPEDLRMDEGDIEHAKKYDAVARRIGIERLRDLIPASPQKVRKALERGDKHLNSIKIRLWDQAAAAIRAPGLSLSEKVCALKHVAKFYYA